MKRLQIHIAKKFVNIVVGAEDDKKSYICMNLMTNPYKS
jgi:hypothetical protein